MCNYVFKPHYAISSNKKDMESFVCIRPKYKENKGFLSVPEEFS